ncbi:MAG: hypothetical protein LBK73_15290 [Treponema sp.]|jgi:hypothetical protein|nr:hypothetical protein [Treponema sp.]
MKNMPIRIMLAVLCIGFLVMACDPEPEEKNIRLIIENNSFYTISNVRWKDNSITGDYGSHQLSPQARSKDYISVQRGSDYLYFTREGAVVMNLRTANTITVDEDTTFTLTNATMVVDTTQKTNTGALSSIGPPATPMTTFLRIKNESTWTINGIKWQDRSPTPAALAPGSSGAIGRRDGASGYIFFTKVIDSSSAKPLSLDCRTQSVVGVETGESEEFVFTDNTIVVDTDDTTNVQPLGTIVGSPTTLTIKNQSFSDLMDVQWQGVIFRTNTVESSIPIGSTVTVNVEPGASYIFFKRKSNPAFARTKEVVVIEKSETEEFVFTDNTLIVEANNPDNTGALKDMTTTVVFFDDAEGEIQGYAERKGSTYYSVSGDLPYYSATSSRNFYHPPYAGVGKSIALGGIADTKLRLSLNLERKAKLSFRYANQDYGTTGAAFSIDGTQKEAWQGNYNWSYLEYTLEAGPHEIVWTKDGHSTINFISYSYLSLDNILVFYIE